VLAEKSGPRTTKKKAKRERIKKKKNYEEITTRKKRMKDTLHHCRLTEPSNGQRANA